MSMFAGDYDKRTPTPEPDRLGIHGALQERLRKAEEEAAVNAQGKEAWRESAKLNAARADKAERELEAARGSYRTVLAEKTTIAKWTEQWTARAIKAEVALTAMTAESAEWERKYRQACVDLMTAHDETEKWERVAKERAERLKVGDRGHGPPCIRCGHEIIPGFEEMREGGMGRWRHSTCPTVTDYAAEIKRLLASSS